MWTNQKRDDSQERAESDRFPEKEPAEKQKNESAGNKKRKLLFPAGLAVVPILLLFSLGPQVEGYRNRPPRFLIDGQTEIVLRLREGNETPPGSLIYRLRGFDADGDPLVFGVKEPVGNEILRIEKTGNSEANVYLRKELDRETRDEYGLVLTLTDGRLGEGNFITQGLLILVEDVNDNAPVFKDYQSTVTIPEDSPPGIVLTVEATDEDEGLYGQVVYRLQEPDGDDDTFSVSTAGGKGVVRLEKELDYENKFLYQLKILAVDRSNGGRVNSGTAAIVVKVGDVEDQPPEFLVVSPVARISEDARVGTQVMRVKAADGDRGVNNPITYSITKGAFGAFEIDPNHGIVYTAQKLDRENSNNDANSGAYILEITAEEQSRTVSPPPSVKTEVTIIVTDVNDETPTFRSEFYEAEINEHAQVNTPVTILGNFVPEVYDHDQGNNGTFRLFIEGGDEIFEVTPIIGINEASFSIRVKDPTKLDYEKFTRINFTLVAKETVPDDPKYSSVSVTIHVRDVNDKVPEFDREVYRVSVPENARKGSAIARVRALDGDSGTYGTEGIRYTALGGSMADFLSLDPETGVITVISERPPFDREFIDRHYLTVEAADDLGRGNRNTVQVIVDVVDVNDNAPKFFQAKYEARLLENHLRFETPLILEARDNDLNGTRNSEIRYSIEEGDEGENFTIDPVSGLLQPKRHIDFEELAKKDGSTGNGKRNVPVRVIALQVRARDLGVPSLSSAIFVFIYVSDMNDHAPVFERAGYDVSIPETLPPGSSVVRVVATDEDASSPNNEVVYRIQKGAKDKFVIDAETGVISVAPGASLDPDLTHPPSTRHSLTVLAIDSGIGTDQFQASAEVNVTIEDVNNKVPTFKEPGKIEVKENANVGEYVFRAVAVDQDSNPILRYRIDGNASEARTEGGTIIKRMETDFVGLFDLNPVTGMLRIRKPIDREKVETIRLALVCEDLAATNGVQKAFAVLTVFVGDENDNSPAFRKPFYHGSVTENSKTGVGVVNVVADDADKNRTVKYSLEGLKTITGLLHLDADTGEIVVADKIDRELTPWLNFSVRATDSGVPPRSSLCEVFIRVLDENDNNPHFLGSLTNLTVREDAPVGKAVGKIEASDVDSGDFGKITYLLDRMSSHGKFRIDPESGVLFVADALDREKESFYALIIEAWDNYQFGYASGESRNAFKRIGVTIADVNDEAPRFEEIDACFSVTEFHDVREAIAVVRASDGDDPLTPNGRMSFAVVRGNDYDLFRIENSDHVSARIVSAAPSLKGFHGNYTLVVQARDLGSPPNVAETEVPICVTDVNDNAPKFVRPAENATVKVPENATVGTPLIQVTAIDEDVGENGVVRYRLRKDSAGSWRTFDIDPLTGVIALKQPLDRERQKIYELRVEGYDLGIPTSLSSDLDLTVHVQNVNDFRPRFLVDEVTLNFTEHQPPGTERRILIEAIDEDESDDAEEAPGQVCYFIVGGNEGGFFSVDPLERELTVERELDREEASQHVLLVKASEDCLRAPANVTSFDEGDDTLLRVIVKVNDVNDHPPKFVKSVFTGGVTTSADFGAEFMRVEAVDEDEGENGRVRYYRIGPIEASLTEGMDGVQQEPFLVDEETGSLHLNFYPRKDMKGYFEFAVVANDSGGLSDTARVYVYLLRKDQRVRFVLRQHPSELRERIDRFREGLKDVTGAVVNVDEFKVHENKDGTVDGTKTDLYLHFVDRKDNSIIGVREILQLVDQNVERLDGLFKEFNVLDTQPSEALRLTDEKENEQIVWLLGGIVFLGIVQVLVLSLCVSQRSRYKRAIKAAKATAFGLDHSRLDVVPRHLPNTNKHTLEGSNPIWMKGCENEWFAESDSSSRTSEIDSLDNNAAVREGIRKTSSEKDSDNNTTTTTTTYISTSHAPPPSLDKDKVVEESDANAGDQQKNFHRSFNTMANSLRGLKKMEATEL